MNAVTRWLATRQIRAREAVADLVLGDGRDMELATRVQKILIDMSDEIVWADPQRVLFELAQRELSK